MRGRSFFGKFLFVLIALVLVLPTAEVLLRVQERLVWLAGYTDTEAGMAMLGVRLNRRLWKMFLTAGAQDLRVLPGNASTAVRLPPNGKWSAVDFLLPEEWREASRFSVSSDSHGFRGPEQKLGKNDYRVLVLGSYQAFGHGVNDEQTYSAHLKELLPYCPRKAPGLRKSKRNYVVWNGGMQSASLDRGLKILEAKLDRLLPNLVILDYGMTDQVSAGMNPWLQPFAALAKPGTWLYDKLDSFSRLNSTGPVGGTYIFSRLVNRSMHANLAANRAHFAGQLEKAIQLLEERKIPVLLLDQPVAAVPEAVYRKAIEGHPLADFLSVREAFKADFRHKQQTLGTEDLAHMMKAGWLDEFPVAFRNYFRKKSDMAPYLGNILHLGPRGQITLALAINDWFEAKYSCP